MTDRGLQCRQCTRPFGFAVPFCPYCGAAQQVAATVRPVPAPPVAVSPGAAPPPAISSVRTAWFLPGRMSVPTVPAASRPATVPVPDLPDTPVPPRSPRRRRGLVALVAIGLLAAILLLRASPSGTLVVYATPGVPGRVTIDGSRVGLPGARLLVPAGRHRVGYDAEGWTAAERQVTVLAHGQRMVTIALAPRPASLAVDVQTPGVTLRLDDRLIDTAHGELKVAPGPHRLTARRPGFAPLALDLLLARGEQRRIPVTLSPLAVREVTRTAVPGQWSEPVLLPPHTTFTLAARSRVRLRVGQDVFLVQPGSSIDLRNVRGQSLQVKAVDDRAIDVHFYLKPEG